MEYLRVKDLKRILEVYNENLPVIITHDGKDHQYGITEKNIFITKYGYFGNDPDAGDAFLNDNEYLNIGVI